MVKKKVKDKETMKYLPLYKKYYRYLLIIPIVMFLLSFIFIFQAIQEDGTPIYRDISLKGGLSAIVTVDTELSLNDVEIALIEAFPNYEFALSQFLERGVRAGFVIDTNLEEEIFFNFISDFFDKEFIVGETYTSNFISPTLSNAFFTQAIMILIISFLLMSTVIFLYFKQVVPSLTVIVSVIFDIVVTIGVLNAMNMTISIAGIGALLMIIGYSVDTDVLLTNRLVKEENEGSHYERAFDAFKTGLLMTVTTLSAGIIALIFTNSPIIQEIALILIVGLLVDFISTWIQNTGILLWWLDKKEGN